MARNLGREFATMTADATPAEEAAGELDMEDPQVADPDAEIAE